MTYILMRSTWDFNSHDHVTQSVEPVLSSNTETDIGKVCERVNFLVSEYKRVRAIANKYRDDLMGSMPYDVMIEKVGPRPKYDHSLEKDVEYNAAHVARLQDWRMKFKEWKAANIEEWYARNNLLTEERYPVLEEIRQHFLLRNIENMICDGRFYRYYPEFYVVSVPNM